MYLDANNLKVYEMSKLLLTSGFKWIDSSNSSKRCVLEVDLEYPKELHELHNDYPFVPDKIEINKEMLSEYQLKIADLCNVPKGNVKKLVLNFFDKEKYVTAWD